MDICFAKLVLSLHPIRGVEYFTLNVVLIIVE